MKVIKSVLSKSLLMAVVMSVICGLIYPLVVTAISQVCFKKQANGSMIEVDGVKYGSELLGQEYTGEGYLWGRVVLANTETFKDNEGNPLFYAGPSNLTPASESYKELVAQRVENIKAANPEMGETKVPVELITSSGSGLDPHISVNAADYQISRIAKARDMKVEDVEAVIKKHTTKKLWGVLGEEVVNVLEVNLELDGKL